MPKKSVEPEPLPKHQLTTKQIRLLILRWQHIESNMVPLQVELAQIKETLVADLDVKDVLTFGPLTLRVMQGNTRSGLQWKKVAMGLAKRLYPDVKSLRRWLQDLARRFPKKPTKPYVRLFTSEDE